MINHNKFRNIARHTRNLWLKFVDPRRIDELAGERVVFNRLKEKGFFNGLEGKRILEIGPKHGKDTMLLAALNPIELVLLDLPEKDSIVREWLPHVPCSRVIYIKGNILYLTKEQHEQLGSFDLVWCLGVLYHNVEQLRLLNKLHDLCKVGE